MMPQSAPNWIVNLWEQEIKENPQFKLFEHWLLADGQIYKRDSRIKRIKQLQIGSFNKKG